MDLRREFLTTIGALVGLNILLAFGMIGLFVRMGPAIERILEDNLESIVAAEEMLAVIAEADTGGVKSAERERFETAWQRIRDNVTEPEEPAVLVAVERSVPGALDGDYAASVALVHDLRELISVNREAMRRADREAKRLGGAGAWAAVLVGFLSFALSLFIMSRLRRRLLTPLVDLHDVLEAAKTGDQFRRCRGSDAPAELRQVLEAVNHLLDERT